MAEAGSFADKVKTQADIVRVISDYVRLKKTGQNFTGLCPFHSEKTPSFAVHPVKQIYHCFGCGVGGDVFSFVMAVDKCDFPEAVRSVAEKCGIPIPKPRARSPEEAQANRQRSTLVEMHKESATFFARQLNDSPEGKIARAYLEDRGLDAASCSRFGLGYAPSSGDALLRALRQKFPEKLIDSSGLVSKDQSGRLFDRFRRRIMFPISNESGKIIAFGGRSLGDDLPKYLNSPESPIYSKSAVLYHLDKAKESIRKEGFAILVEGYMDAIALASAGIVNVVASCGTSVTETQVRLLKRFTNRVVVNFDPDTAGVTAGERTIGQLSSEMEMGRDVNTALTNAERKRSGLRRTELLKQDFQVKVLILPADQDPDKFVRQNGVMEYRTAMEKAPDYLDYLIQLAKRNDLSSSAGKVQSLNFLLQYIMGIPNLVIRSEWATRIASQLRIEEPVLREAFRKAAAERKSEVKPKAELVSAGPKPAERRLLRMLIDAEGFRETLAKEIRAASLHAGLETEKIFDALLAANESGARPDPAELSPSLSEKDRRLLFEVAFEPAMDSSWEEAESCLAVLRRRHVETELFTVQQRIEANPPAAEMRTLLARKTELRRLLSSLLP